MVASRRSSVVYRSAKRRARMPWWFSPALGGQPRTRCFMESWTIAMNRSSPLWGSGSPQESMVSSRSATWAPTFPSGCAARGCPQASPCCKAGSSASRRSSSLSGSNPGTRLLDALGEPAFIAAREGYPHLLAVADRHELCPVLHDPGAVVDEHQVQPLVSPARTGVRHRVADRRLHHFTLPALVRGPSLLERLVAGGDLVRVVARLHA